MATISSPASSRFSDRRHLLSDTASVSTRSIASTLDSENFHPRSPSDQGTPQASTPIPGKTQPQHPSTPIATSQPYRGFPSEAAYLEALREWVEEKMYLTPETSLFGWYGTKTQMDYLDRLGGGPGLMETLKEKMACRQGERERRRRASDTDMGEQRITEEEGEVDKESGRGGSVDHGMEGEQLVKRKFGWPRKKNRNKI